MKKKIAITSGLSLSTLTLAGAIFLSFAGPTCACGGTVPGTAKYHWNEMSLFDKVRFQVTGHVPFDSVTGARL